MSLDQTTDDAIRRLQLTKTVVLEMGKGIIMRRPVFYREAKAFFDKSRLSGWGDDDGNKA